MNYGDLIQFEPIESVVQLRSADRERQAKRLVSSYVISEQMAEKLTGVIIPELQFEEPHDNMGLLIVGNYGTGKSHLMSVISAVAEHAELAGELQSQEVAQAAAPIAGKFKVIRTEIGATTMSLREIITAELTDHLAAMGVDYRFPAADQIVNNKSAFEDMMAAFSAVYPDQGLLLVIDELLDYLRARKDLDLILDLGLLRELGEVCRDLRFRVIAGLQEMLFDNPRFSFTASSLARVKDRFEQIQIDRTDVKYVVAERLLKKTADQQVKIRDHLSPFPKFYGHMNERMEDFVRLFPVHPDYIDVFDRISYAEKREVLKTLSKEMQERLDRPVPDDEPGVIAYDSYWETLSTNPGLRAVPEIREVVDCARVLEGRIEAGFPRPASRPMAIRIIRALAIQRLTTGDIYSKIGVTAEELRDGLCLFDPTSAELGGDVAENLLTQVESVLGHIMRTVSGQFISRNEENGQYYLDLKKNVDYDARIANRAGSLQENELDRYYYEALRQVVLEDPDAGSYVTGYEIWEYELEWTERRATRRGYLFFGAPNERSTAVPERDFYLYFLQPFAPPRFRNEQRPDEVFFRLKPDDDLIEILKKYAAARLLSADATGEAKRSYNEKADDYRKRLTGWLRDHMMLYMEVSHGGKSKALLEWLKGKSAAVQGASANVRDAINAAGSVCLAGWFEEEAPRYPKFSVLITARNRPQAAQDALRVLRGTVTQQGTAVLDALQLLDGDQIVPRRSEYARYILDILNRKGQGQVVNRDEIITDEGGVDYMAPHDFRLEPEWVAVLLAALVYNGDAVLALPGQKFDAGNLDILVTTPVERIADFKHIERPREWPLPAIRALYALVDLPPGNAQLVTQGDAGAVNALQGKIGELVKALVLAGQQVQSGIPFWGGTLLDAREQEEYRKLLDGAKTFLESLQAYNTPAKLKNLRYDEREIAAQQAGLEALAAVDALRGIAAELGPLASYLSQAEIALPSGDAWVQDVDRRRRELLDALRARGASAAPALRGELRRTLEDLKRRYVETYLTLHTRARLGMADDRRKKALLNDPRLKELRRLAGIELMPAAQLHDLETELASLRTCTELTDAEMQTHAICPHCSFKPVNEEAAIAADRALANADEGLDQLLATWTATLADNLADPIVKDSLTYLPESQREPIERLIDTGRLPDPLSDTFIEGVQEVLKGFSPVTVSAADLGAALGNGGAPARVDEVRQRFDDFLTDKTRGKDPQRVRIVLE